jgi:hypothetical protein
MLSTLINRIYLNNLSCLLNRKDKRSIRTWCSKNHVNIYKDTSGEFVIQNEFELAYNMPLIKDLKKKHGDYWIDYYEAYNKGDLHKILDLNTKKETAGYVPKGKLSIKLFGGSPK